MNVTLFSHWRYPYQSKKRTLYYCYAHHSMDISKPINLGLCQLLGPVLNKTTRICIKSQRATEAQYARFPDKISAKLELKPSSTLQAGMSTNFGFPSPS